MRTDFLWGMMVWETAVKYNGPLKERNLSAIEVAKVTILIIIFEIFMRHASKSNNCTTLVKDIL